VIKHLDDMCKALQESMKTKANEIFMQMNRDYTQVLGGATSDQPVSLQSEEERQLRSDIRQILEGVDALFEPILNGNIALEVEPTNGTSGQAEEQNDVDVEDGRAIFDSQHDFHEDDADNPVPTQTTSYEPEQRSEMDLDDGEQVDDGESYQEEI
jgi:hypothetical protein